MDLWIRLQDIDLFYVILFVLFVYWVGFLRWKLPSVNESKIKKSGWKDWTAFDKKCWLNPFTLVYCFELAREKLMIYRRQILLAVVWFGSTPQRDYFCKRAILCLSRLPKYWPPLHPASLYPPPLLGERRAERGWGVNILEDERRRIALLQ